MLFHERIKQARLESKSQQERVVVDCSIFMKSHEETQESGHNCNEWAQSRPKPRVQKDLWSKKNHQLIPIDYFKIEGLPSSWQQNHLRIFRELNVLIYFNHWYLLHQLMPCMLIGRSLISLMCLSAALEEDKREWVQRFHVSEQAGFMSKEIHDCPNSFLGFQIIEPCQESSMHFTMWILGTASCYQPVNWSDVY